MSDNQTQTPLLLAARPVRALVLAMAVCGIWTAIWWSVARSESRVPRPFAWPDVALVSILCWVPVGLVIADSLLRVSRLLGVLLAGIGLSLSSLLLLDLPGLSGFGPAWLVHSFWGGLIGVSAAVLAGAGNLARNPERPPVWPAWSLGLLVPLMAIASATYAADRAKYYDEQLQMMLSHGRFHEARQLIRRLRLLDPDRTINDKSLPLLAAELNRHRKSLEREIPLIREKLAESGGSSAERADLKMRLARNLVMLGQTEEAVQVLAPLTEGPAALPSALNLRATILEYQERWDESLRYYDKARDRLTSASTSNDNKSQLAKAWKGIAYTQRKRGRYLKAEAAYQRLLELAPSAENHFLMAKFYEDAQQGDRAQVHAEKAAELKPDVYREQATSLINSMQSDQFGCFSIFQNRND